MSQLYSMEPNPSGKVLLHTTHGPLLVELWCKECPRAGRNFIQLCLEGYYDNSSFHRIVPGFCVQTGKPAQRFVEDGDDGDLLGEAAVAGGRFALEQHSRLRWTRRGLMGMVAMSSDSSASPTTTTTTALHGSQFCFTLSETPELAGKSTLFGRLAGDSIYNLLRIGELDTNEPAMLAAMPRILSTEVLVNPFDDIVPRQLKPLPVSVVSQATEPTATGKKTLGLAAKKNLSLLSFADETEDGTNGRGQPQGKGQGKTIKSSHDVMNSSPQLSSLQVQVPSKGPVHPAPSATSALPARSASSAASSSLQFLQQMKSMHMQQTQRQIEQLEKDLRLTNSEDPKKTEEPVSEPQTDPSLLSAVERHRLRYLKGSGKAQAAKRKPDAKDEMETLLMLNQFRQKLQKSTTAPEANPPEPRAAPVKHLDICKLHGLVDCLSCRDTFGLKPMGTEEDDGEDWLLHRLVFDRQKLDESIREDLRQLLVIDPREEAQRLGIKPK
jgi:peptidyl-prolyl cis-trans isomerase SDCCAG10